MTAPKTHSSSLEKLGDEVDWVVHDIESLPTINNSRKVS